MRSSKSRPSARARFIIVALTSTLVLASTSPPVAAMGPCPSTISVNGNSDMLAQATLHGWSGTGTSANPVVITGCTFNLATGATAILIQNVNLHFTLSNHFIIGSGGLSTQTGIQLVSSFNGLVDSNMIGGTGSGIIIDGGGDHVTKSNAISQSTALASMLCRR